MTKIKKKTIAIAGAGDVAKYVAEELKKINKYKIIILSRSNREWFIKNNFEIRITDYTKESILSCIKDVNVLISLIHDNSDFYNKVHIAMIDACKESHYCKHFIPSECGGDIEKFPQHPLFYVPTHGAIRKILKEQSEIKYTFFNNGWFMDYFIDGNKSYMKRLPGIWPLDIENSEIIIPGSGNENITFTSARDVGKALSKLIDFDDWDEYIYVSGETTTWNKIAKWWKENIDEKLNIKYRKLEEIIKSKEEHINDEDPTLLWKDYMDLWNATGAASVPNDKVILQRNKYFLDINFMNIEMFVKKSKELKEII